MSKKPVSLFLTRLTPDLWRQFNGFYETRKLNYRPLAVPPAGVWVVDWIGSGTEEEPTSLRLIAGCCIYPCNGPFAVVEYVSTNPAVSSRVRHTAVEKISWGVSHFGAMNGQTMLCFPINPGVERVMRKAGYMKTVDTLRGVFFAPVLVPVHHEPGDLVEPAIMEMPHG